MNMNMIPLLALANAALLLLTAVILIRKGEQPEVQDPTQDPPAELLYGPRSLARLDEVVTRLDSLKAEVARLTLIEHRRGPGESAQKNYLAAGQLAGSGSSVREIMQACDLPEAEARLARRWQSAKESINTADTV